MTFLANLVRNMTSSMRGTAADLDNGLVGLAAASQVGRRKCFVKEVFVFIFRTGDARTTPMAGMTICSFRCCGTSRLLDFNGEFHHLTSVS